MNYSEYNAIRRVLNYKPSTGKLLFHLAVDLAIVGVLASAVYVGSYVGCLVSVILSPILYFRSFALFHDAVHGSAHSSAPINRAVGILYGIFAFLPFESWRRLHLEHHYWSGNLDKDPSMQLVKHYRQVPKKVQRLYNFCWRYRLPLLAVLQQVVFWKISIAYAFGHRRERGARGRYIISVAVPLIFYLSTLMLMPLDFTLLFFFPGYIAYMILVEEINSPHHLQLPMGKGDLRLNPMEQYKVSRTCIYSKWIELFITNNFNYHTEHHLFPALPWYELSNVNKILLNKKDLALNIDVGNAWIAKNRKQKLEKVLAPTSELLQESQLPKAS